ncbi:MAG: helix-turn-helix domain-containing protein [Oceanospirillaceae bacterium]|nr:helix-turn-helix domain-containing protein [Oceanospirillaceae bacterium]
MENPFEEKIEGLDTLRWLSVDDCSEQLGVSRRTIFKYIKDGNFKTTKWKNKRIIDSVSVIGWLLKKKVIEINSIKNSEMRKEIEVQKFTKMGDELFD